MRDAESESATPPTEPGPLPKARSAFKPTYVFASLLVVDVLFIIVLITVYLLIPDDPLGRGILAAIASLGFFAVQGALCIIGHQSTTESRWQTVFKVHGLVGIVPYMVIELMPFSW